MDLNFDMCDDYDFAVCTPSATKKAKRGHSKLTTAAPKAAPKARKTPVNAVAPTCVLPL